MRKIRELNESHMEAFEGLGVLSINQKDSFIGGIGMLEFVSTEKPVTREKSIFLLRKKLI